MNSFAKVKAKSRNELICKRQSQKQECTHLQKAKPKARMNSFEKGKAKSKKDFSEC
jgi:hypothetical protein